MKLWLLEILACPMDHAYPLELTIFRWMKPPKSGKKPRQHGPENMATQIPSESGDSSETSKTPSDAIAELIQGYRQGHVLGPKEESPIIIEQLDEGLFVRDYLVLKPTTPIEYYTALLEKIDELKVVRDLSTWQGTQALTLIQEEIAAHLRTARDQLTALKNDAEKPLDATEIEAAQRQILESTLVDLEFLNLFKYTLEIEEGVMRCPQCGRWFPIFETIPQMLPDNLRNKETDAAVVTKWKKKYQF